MGPEEFKELLLSHHPNQPCFDDDVIVLFNRRICAGCLLAYPTALAVLLVFRPFAEVSILIALVLAVLSQARRLIKNPAVQHFFRLVAGIALGFGLGGMYWAVVNGQWVLIFLLIAGAGLYLLMRILSMKWKIQNSSHKSD
jgi:hypothetical protein